MLKANQISKSYGLQPVLKSASFSLKPGERAGLVGPNGSGKTTLLRILAGVERPDAGSVLFTPASLRLGYLPQGLEFAPGQSLADFLARSESDEVALAAELERLAAALAKTPTRSDLQLAYDATLARLSSAHQAPGRAEQTLAALGLGPLSLETPLANLSGGQKTRLALADVLLSDPQLLLLDEPTNHLDMEMLEWLEDWLNTYRGAVLIVSHDRTFLDKTVTGMLELDPKTHGLRVYAGNFADYIQQRLAEQERQWNAWRDQAAEISGMKADIARTKEQALRIERSTTPRQPGVRRIAKKVAIKAQSREKKLVRYLEASDRVEKPQAGWQMKLVFGDAPASGQDVLVLDELAIGYGDRPLASGLNAHLRHGARVALIGPNGAGKTTLARTVAGRMPPLAGRARLGANVRLGYMAQEQELLDPALNVYETVRRLGSMTETDARSFLHYFLFAGDDVFVLVGDLSFGERARLSLASLVVQGCNFLLLDEPINHLDIPSRARFEQALSTFEGTVVAIVHDRFFIAGFATEIWRLAEGRLEVE